MAALGVNDTNYLSKLRGLLGNFYGYYCSSLIAQTRITL